MFDDAVVGHNASCVPKRSITVVPRTCENSRRSLCPSVPRRAREVGRVGLACQTQTAMADAVKKVVSYADVIAVPDSKVAEVVDNKLYASPRPAPRHARAMSVLGGELMGPFDRGRGGPGGWIILDEPELHFEAPLEVLVPDLAGWRRERMPELPETSYFTLAPDWVCEVLSPSTQLLDRSKKLPVYHREHVHHAWLIDPLARTLEIYAWRSEGYLLVATHGADTICRAEPFEAIELELRALWNV